MRDGTGVSDAQHQGANAAARISRLYLYAAAAAMPVLFGAYTLALPFGRDQGIHATIAAALQDGFVTYRDVYNVKPPMTTAVHWLALDLFGHSVMSIRLLDLLLAALAAMALAAAARGLLRSSIGALSVALAFSVLYYAQVYWDTAQTDGWATMCLAGALYFLTSAWSRAPGAARSVRIGLAGMLMGVAFAFKYTIAGAGVLIFAPALCRSDEAAFHWSDLRDFVAGGLGFLLLLSALLAAAGALGPYIEIQRFLAGYVAFDGKLSLLQASIDILLRSHLAAVVVLTGAVVFVERLIVGKLSLYMTVAALALVAGWLAGAVQGKGLLYHFLPVLIGFAMLFGLVMVRIESALRHRKGAMRIFCIALFASMLIATPGFKRNADLAAALVSGTSLREQWARHADEGDFSFLDIVEFNDVLSGHRRTKDPLFVWGFDTSLYFLQGATPVHRYPYAWPFAVDFYDGRYTADLLHRLRQLPPAHIVVQKQDSTPWATGHDMDSRQVLDRHPEIHRFLSENYVRVETTPRFDLWRRAGS